MPHPPAALTAALTDRYRVKRELGVGGMATVYLAEDTKHRRDVAVKVLRPDLAVSLGAERFLREIEIAASLHHPHILPLYDSGGAGDVLFYVMPFVPGQSLRDRLEKASALPIDDAVRILREVGDALEYSHTQGVVHRDIKPENILLSGAHALVTDFGVAKALTDAAASSSITSTGMALGTPTYMAPEQATADPQLDHRVDIYALGVMAYEMLAGRAPFLGTNPQQVLAGHLAHQPDPLSRYRASVPPALEAIVMRCLEKNPADRWQKAGEFVQALEALPTNSGATAAMSAAPASVASSGQASAAETVASGRVASPPGASAPSTSNPRGRKRLVTAGVLVIVLSVLGVGWYRQDGRAGTLIGDAVLARNDLLLVSEFANRTADSTLAQTVTDAVRVELQQSRVVDVMSQAAMWDALDRMGLAHDAVLEESKAQELAEREGAKAFVVGDVARLGSGYQLTARVVASSGGSEAFTARATASNDDELIGAVEELGRALRRGIGESLRDLAAAPPLAKVTTASLPALKLYTAASRAENDGQRDRAIALANEALVIDSTFASVWRLLFVMHANNGATQLATRATERAYALRDRLSEKNRWATEADYHRGRNDTIAEEAAIVRSLELGGSPVSYADFLLKRQRFDEAEGMARRGVTEDPSGPVGWWNLIEAQVAQRDFVGADSSLAGMERVLPGHVFFRLLQVHTRFAQRDFDELETFLADSADRELRATRVYRCFVQLQRARFEGWRQCADGAMPGARDYPKITLAEFRLTGDSAPARRVLQSFVDTPSDDRDPDTYAWHIALAAELGDVARARSLLDSWRAMDESTRPGFLADSALAVGAIAAAEQRWEPAVRAFRAWRSGPLVTAIHEYNRGLAEAAFAYDKLGAADSARVLLERALSVSSVSTDLGYEATWYAPALERLGDLYAERGDRAKASDYYRRYVDLLRDAEAPMDANVRAVRAKLERVVAEPAR